MATENKKLTTYWTIQTKAKWNQAQKLGYLVGEFSFIDEDYKEPYHWMMAQMKKRIPHYGGEYPVWLWTERPDLRESGYLERGEQGVLLKIELHFNTVLLSDFQAWHMVLNNSYMSLEEVTEDEVYPLEEIRKSWELIFELNQLKASEMWGEPHHLQGVTGKIKTGQIDVMKEFKAR